MHTSKVICVLSVIALRCCGLASAAELSIVAQTGQPHEAGSPTEFNRFFVDNSLLPLPRPVINQNGSVLFQASLQGPGATASTDRALYLRNASSSRTIARKYYPVPNVSGTVVYSEFFNSTLSTSDDAVAFSMRLAGASVTPGVNDRAVLRADWTATDLIIRSGDEAPGYAPGLFSNFLAPILSPFALLPIVPAAVSSPSNAQGAWIPGLTASARILEQRNAPAGINAQVADFETFYDNSGPSTYHVTLSGGDVTTISVNGTQISNATALFVETAQSTPILVARSGQALTSDPMGPVLASILRENGRPSTNAQEDVLFSGLVTNRTTGQNLGLGVWRWRSGALTQLLGVDSSILGLPGVAVSGFGSNNTGVNLLELLEDGSALLLATLSGPGVSSTNDQAFLHLSESGVRLIARTGTQAQGVASGITYGTNAFNSKIRISPQGSLAFRATLSGPGITAGNDHGVWISQGGAAPEMAFRESDQLPVLINGVEYPARIADASNLGALLVNDSGHALARVRLAWVGDSSGNTYDALLARLPTGTVELLAMSGVPLAHSSGTTAPVGTFELDEQQGLNQSGEAVFVASFGQLQGIVKATLAGVAECRADFNHDGSSDVQDIFAFLSAWFSQDLTADFDQSGSIAVPDIFSFLAVWFEGC